MGCVQPQAFAGAPLTGTAGRIADEGSRVRPPANSFTMTRVSVQYEPGPEPISNARPAL
jgi:hypothetical protein